MARGGLRGTGGLAGLAQALAGRCSCGCFGSLSISPWFVLVFDLLAVAALLGSHSPRGSEAIPPTSSMPLLGQGMITLVVGIGGWGQADLVTVAGRATADGHPLQEITLTFTGNSGKILVCTDPEGRFRLSFVRPGQYSVFATGQVITQLIAERKSDAKVRGKGDKRRPERLTKIPKPTDANKLPLLWIDIPKCSVYHVIIKI